ncbi:hypothetical protein JNUCC1_02852 [Lentibacillus sp. JNUCC-1]|uniref:2Fe-2S iron-sulfur cluster-binding protein n=1 Tax=Lentibacillus sp. JNUCC-1 TaxID=2654513 RepID=UPI0012E79533|nr:2Fe-2S iron-sulfur cluster-binding protein [Lentibacillus sp. JNUCC-1]MUV38980.1 hypothetical protein [Lentibacillus sp. JNUCC-1]
MAHVIFIGENDRTYTIHIKEGHTILRAARQGHVPLRHKCGGRASCTTCKVNIADQSQISEPNHKEHYKLGDANISSGMRLSCQTKVYGHVTAHIPQDPYRARINALLKQQQEDH